MKIPLDDAQILILYQKTTSVPDELSVGEVSELLKVPPSQVRTMVKDNLLRANVNPVSHRLTFYTVDFVQHENFLSFVCNQQKLKENSLSLVKTMIKIFEED